MSIDRTHLLCSLAAAVFAYLITSHYLPVIRWVVLAFAAGALLALCLILYVILSTARQNVDPGHDRSKRATLAFTRTVGWERAEATLKEKSEYHKSALWPKLPQASAQYDELIGILLDTHVTSWYSKICRRPLFQNEIDKVLRATIGNLGQSIGTVDLVEAVVLRIVPIITSHMQDFYVAERLVRGKNLTRQITESEELDMAIAAKYKDGKIHPAASLAATDMTSAQHGHIRKTIKRILPKALPQNMLSSGTVLVLIREIVSCAVLAPLMNMLADPDTLNQLIDNVGRGLLQDRKTVKRLRAALDEHASAASSSARPVDYPRIRPNDSERHFERFIRTLRGTDTLADARKFRNQLANQLRREDMTGQRDTVFVRRLQAGRRILEQRINALSSKTDRMNADVRDNEALAAQMRNAPLRDVLHSASGSSYFMEFMDRRQRMRVIQFWITIDGFRNPLEEDNEDTAWTLQEKTTYISSERIEIAQVKAAYIDEPGLTVNDVDRAILDRCVSLGSDSDMQVYLAARRAVLRIQTAAYEDMRENDYEAFKQSDLFVKWVSVEDGMNNIRNASTTKDSQAQPVDRPDAEPLLTPRVSIQPSRARRGMDGMLRRAAASSADLTSALHTKITTEPRRSVDDMAVRPLFDTDVEDERMSQSVASLRSVDSQAGRPEETPQVVETMQKRLDHIMDQASTDTALFDTLQETSPDLPSSIQLDDSDHNDGGPKTRPDLASLGLVTGRSYGVFAEDLFVDEQQQFREDETEAIEENKSADLHDDIKEAAPGDLGLSEAIHALNTQIDKLSAQDRIVDSLTKKAELTNNTAELRILRKSKQSLRREVERAQMQKQQYVLQESDNGLYGKATIGIRSVMVGKEPDGHEYAIYVIEVRREAGDSMPAATWSVTRRYSEFHDLHKRLRALFTAVKTLEFPRRQILFTLQKDFLRKRKTLLERYLCDLIRIPSVCRSREFRSFLSDTAISSVTPVDASKNDQGDFVARIYNSVSDGVEELLGNAPALDQLSVAGQSLISAASAQLSLDTSGHLQTNTPAPVLLDPAMTSDVEAEIEAFEDRDATPFVKPISDLFVETFELHKGNSWLRGRAVVVILHQLLGGTVERKIREYAKSMVQETAIVGYMLKLKEALRPPKEALPDSIHGAMTEDPATKTVRTTAEKAQSRKEATLVLATLIPDMSSGVVGRANAQAASRKISAMLNNQRLNMHLAFTLFDEIVSILFPEPGARTIR